MHLVAVRFNGTSAVVRAVVRPARLGGEVADEAGNALDASADL